MARKSFVVTLLIALSFCASKAGIRTKYHNAPPSNLHIISIGINKYYNSSYTSENCVNDSKVLVDHLKKSYSLLSKTQISQVKSWWEMKRQSDPKANPAYHTSKVHQEFNSFLDSIGVDRQDYQKYSRHGVENVFAYSLHDEEATKTGVINLFKEVVTKAQPNDYFIFQFAGLSSEDKTAGTYLSMYVDSGKTKNNDEARLYIGELANLMEQIECNKQFILSEAGIGESFAIDLISELYELDPLKSFGSNRERIVLTTKGIGYDGIYCDGTNHKNGPLTNYLINSGGVLDVFTDYDYFQLDLIMNERKCPAPSGYRYSALYRESDYRKIFQKSINNLLEQKGNSRGAKSKKLDSKSTPINESITYALVVATNNYGNNSGWSTLKNPINDAEKISQLLDQKYGVEITKVYNKPRDSMLSNLILIRQKMDSNDKFILFFAGHGYYSETFTDGNIVFADSKNLKDDPYLDSYLQMSTLRRLLNTLPCNSVFTIFDVCFGASFDLLSKDLTLSNYNSEMDITLKEFDKRKSKNLSRIFLASGRYEVPDYWNNSSNHSPFANKIIKQLENEKTFMSPGKLYAKLEGNATEPFLKQFGSHHPKGDFILLVK